MYFFDSMVGENFLCNLRMLFWTTFLQRTDHFACVPVSDGLFPHYDINRREFLLIREEKK